MTDNATSRYMKASMQAPFATPNATPVRRWFGLPTFFVAAMLCVLSSDRAFAQVGIYIDIINSRFLQAEKAGEERIRTPEDRTTRNLAPLCYVYYKLRRYNKLFTCVAQLETAIAKGDNIHSDSMVFASDATSLPHVLKSGAFLELGDAGKALEEGERALALVKEGYKLGWLNADQYYVEALPILGVAASLLGRRPDTGRYIQKLEDIAISYAGGLHRANYRDVGLAMMQIALGRYEKALEIAQRGEHFTISRVFGNIFFGGGDSLATFYELPRALMIAKCHLELGHISEAKAALNSLLENKRAPEQGDIFWISLFERGRVAEREGKPDEAIEYYRRAIEVIERQRASLTTEATKIGFVGNKQHVYARLVTLLVAAGRAAEAFDYVERSKARALVDMLAQKKDFAVRGEGAARARQVLAEMDRAQLDAQSLAVPAGPADGTRSLRNLQDEMRSADPELSSLVTVTSVPAEEIRALLAPDEALVEYYYDDSALYAFIVAADGVHAAQLERPGLGEAVSELRREIERPPTDGFRAPAQRLYARLIAPIEAQLKAAKLVIVPHGALHYVPFAALLAPDGRFLVDRYVLRAEPSASVLKFLRPAAERPSERVLALGNPDLGDPNLDLAFAEREARAVAGMFPGSRVLLRKDATETAFREDASSFTRIHLATHGRFRADSPLDSGLYLAKDAENDGVLRVAELYTMSLDADLVTLSACETALGKVDNGDDVVGLTRGFLYAGARSIVSSLWSVDDRATAELMRTFYANLQTLDKRDALRQAQLRTRETFPHPFFWAPFQLIGRP